MDSVGAAIFDDPVFHLIANLPFDEQKKQLITTLFHKKVQSTPENIVDICEIAVGKIPGVNSEIVWMEQGIHNPKDQGGHGLIHIKARHLQQFEDKGIAANQIPGLAMAATSAGWLVATKGKRGSQSPTCIYVLKFNGEDIAVVILVANNGYIVTMHPYSWHNMLKLARKSLSANEMKLLESWSPNIVHFHVHHVAI